MYCLSQRSTQTQKCTIGEMYYIGGDIAAATEYIGYAVSGTSSSGYFYNANSCSPNYFLALTTEDYGGDLMSILGLAWETYSRFCVSTGFRWLLL